jgi:hypothetical protein
MVPVFIIRLCKFDTVFDNWQTGFVSPALFPESGIAFSACPVHHFTYKPGRKHTRLAMHPFGELSG